MTPSTFCCLLCVTWLSAFLPSTWTIPSSVHLPKDARNLLVHSFPVSLWIPSSGNSSKIVRPRKISRILVKVSTTRGRTSSSSSAQLFASVAPDLFSCSLLVFAGDVEINPGPANSSTLKPKFKFPCGSCAKPVRANQAGILCDLCCQWWHSTCCRMGNDEYASLGSTATGWVCPTCHKESLPFHDLSNLSELSNRSSEDSSFEDPDNSADVDLSFSRSPGKNTLSFWYNNCRSLKNKLPEFQAMLASSDNTVFAITESWLDNSVCDREITLSSSFDVHRLDRKSRGGGVLLCAPSRLRSMRRLDLEIPDLELLWVEIGSPDFKYLVGVFYRPPSAGLEVSRRLSDSLRLVDQHSHRYRNIILFGDFNVPLAWDVHPPTPNSLLSTGIIDTMASAGLSQVCKHPTFSTHAGVEHFLDLVFLRDLTGLVCCDLEADFGSDHTPLSLRIKGRLPRTIICRRKFLQFSKGDLPHLAKSFSCINWDFFLDVPNIDEAWANWLDIYHAAIADSIPCISLSSASSRHPWSTPEIAKLSTKKRALFRKARQDKQASSLTLARVAQRKLKKAIRLARSDYLASLASRARDNPGAFWAVVSGLRRPSAGLTIKTSDGDTSNPTEISSLFCDHFASNWSDCNPPDYPRPQKLSHVPSFSDVVFPVADVRDALLKLSASGSVGPDGVSPRIIRLCANELTPSLVTLFSKSMACQKLPSLWKQAHTVPLYKGGSLPRDNVSSYRPISITSTICRTMERVVLNQLSVHLEQHGILPPEQFGFRRGRSCEQSLVKLADEWSRILDDCPGAAVDVLLFDFASAFDKVSPCLLNHKLSKIGIDGQLLSWLADFLTGRTQAVKYKGILSDSRSVRSGVPQGSVLGPVLFDIFVADLPSSISVPSNQFADDLVAHNRIKCPGDCAKLQKAADEVLEWSLLNLLPINVSKCKSLHITHSRKTQAQKYLLGGEPIPQVSSARLLGVVFNKALSFNDHVNDLCARANRTLGFCSRFSTGMGAQVFKTLYTALVLPLLDYCCSVWDPAQTFLTDRVESIQRRATALAWCRATGLKYASRPEYEERLRFLGWRSLASRRSLAKLKLFCKIVTGIIPHDTSLLSRLNLNRRTRQPLPVVSRTVARSNATLPSASRIWLSLPRNISHPMPNSPDCLGPVLTLAKKYL